MAHSQAVAHHELFQAYPPWRGITKPAMGVDFLGVHTRNEFWPPWPKEPGDQEIEVAYPPFDEEYFEWISLLSAVKDATGRFTMIELGAGWGRWLGRAAAAIRKTTRYPFLLVGVEAEPTHFLWMKKFLRDNGIDPNRHWLLKAAVSDKPGWVTFLIGNPDKWYGQSVLGDQAPIPPSIWSRLLNCIWPRKQSNAVEARTVRAITLNAVLRRVGLVDLVDADIQGSEASVFEAAADLLNAQVKAVHIGTHSEEQETRLRALFSRLDWVCRYDFACMKEQETPFGRITFGDGVQAWTNPQFCSP